MDFTEKKLKTVFLRVPCRDGSVRRYRYDLPDDNARFADDLTSLVGRGFEFELTCTRWAV